VLQAETAARLGAAGETGEGHVTLLVSQGLDKPSEIGAAGNDQHRGNEQGERSADAAAEAQLHRVCSLMTLERGFSPRLPAGSIVFVKGAGMAARLRAESIRERNGLGSSGCPKAL
jgi:hypothetical protein